MKRTILLLTAALVLTACGGGKFAGNPVAEALTSHILSLYPEGYQFQLTDLQKVDSTTFATEFEQRKVVFGLQVAKNEELYVRFKTNGQPKNAALKLQAMHNGARILRGLDSLKTLMEDELENIAYYDYRFSGHLTKGRRSLDYTDAWFTITPTNEVLVVVTTPKDLHKSGGKAIPGYMELLKGSDESQL